MLTDVEMTHEEVAVPQLLSVRIAVPIFKWSAPPPIDMLPEPEAPSFR